MFDSTKGKNLLQFIKFSIVGLSNTLISEITYVILVYFNMHYIPASFIGFSISTLNAFYWNNKYVFSTKKESLDRQSKESNIKLFAKTYLAYSGSYILTAVLLCFWIDIIHISQWMELPSRWFLSCGFQNFDQDFLGKSVAAFINLCITVPLNFFVNKYWAFRSRKE